MLIKDDNNDILESVNNVDKSSFLLLAKSICVACEKYICVL